MLLLFYFLKIYSSFERNQGDFTLGIGEAYFTDADLDCSDFPFVLIAQNESRLGVFCSCHLTWTWLVTF